MPLPFSGIVEEVLGSASQHVPNTVHLSTRIEIRRLLDGTLGVETGSCTLRQQHVSSLDLLHLLLTRVRLMGSVIRSSFPSKSQGRNAFPTDAPEHIHTSKTRSKNKTTRKSGLQVILSPEHDAKIQNSPSLVGGPRGEHRLTRRMLWFLLIVGALGVSCGRGQTFELLQESHLCMSVQ